MNLTQRLVFTLSALIIAVAAHAAPLRIGATPGMLADSVEVAAVEARRRGLDVKIVELTDWTTPNVALTSGDLDLNYFQHQVSLDNMIKERGYIFKSVGIDVLDNISLYSSKIKRLSDLEDGARAAVANDPVNQGRSLLLLQRAELIKLYDSVGARNTLNDMVINPKRLKFVEAKSSQLVHAPDDVDLTQGYPTHLANAGKPDVASIGLLHSGIDNEYFAIRLVACNDNANGPRIARFVKLYQDSLTVRQQVRTSYANDNKPLTLPQAKR